MNSCEGNKLSTREKLLMEHIDSLQRNDEDKRRLVDTCGYSEKLWSEVKLNFCGFLDAISCTLIISPLVSLSKLMVHVAWRKT